MNNIKKGIIIPFFLICNILNISGQTEITANGAFNHKPDINNSWAAYPLDKVEGWTMVRSCDYFFSEKGGYSYAFGVMGWEFPVCILKEPLKRGCTYNLQIDYLWRSSIYNQIKIGAAFLTKEDWSHLEEKNVRNLQPYVSFKANRKSKKGWKSVSIQYTASGKEEYILLGLVGSVIHDSQAHIRYRNVSLKALEKECDLPNSSSEVMEETNNIGERENKELGVFHTYYYNSASFKPINYSDSIISVINAFTPKDSVIIKIKSYCDTIGTVSDNKNLALQRAKYIQSQIEVDTPNIKKKFSLQIVGESEAISDGVFDRKTEVFIYKED